MLYYEKVIGCCRKTIEIRKNRSFLILNFQYFFEKIFLNHNVNIFFKYDVILLVVVLSKNDERIAVF